MGDCLKFLTPLDRIVSFNLECTPREGAL